MTKLYTTNKLDGCHLFSFAIVSRGSGVIARAQSESTARRIAKLLNEEKAIRDEMIKHGVADE